LFDQSASHYTRVGKLSEGDGKDYPPITERKWVCILLELLLIVGSGSWKYATVFTSCFVAAFQHVSFSK